MKRRILCLLMALLLLLPLLASCTDPTDDPTPEDVKDPEQVVDGEKTPDEEVEVNPYDVPDSLPDVKYDGREFIIHYYRDAYAAFFYQEAQSGDLISNTIWASNVATEERFDVDIQVLPGSDDEGAYNIGILAQMQTGQTDFDVCHMSDRQGGNMSVADLLLNIREMPQFDFEKPWWSPHTVDSLTYMGQMHLISTAMSWQGLGATQVVFFNKKLMNDHDIEAPYQAVLDGEWYLEDMIYDAEDVYKDINGDGKTEDDIYGILMPEEMYSVVVSYGINLIEKSDDGAELIFNGADERMYTLIDQYHYILNQSDFGYATARDNTAKMFMQEQGLYLTIQLDYVTGLLRDAAFEYGIVPYPKLDELQDGYYAGHTDRFFVIPNTCTDTDFVATIIEGMSAEGYRQMTPAIYETALKGRYTHDDASVKMLDIINSSRVQDFAYIYVLQACTRALAEVVAQGKSNNYSSYYASKVTPVEQRIEELQTKFAAMLQ